MTGIQKLAFQIHSSLCLAHMKWIGCLLMLLVGSVQAQITGQDIPLGTWRTHLSYTAVVDVEATRNGVFAATQGGLFKYDPEDGSLEAFSKISGLSDANIRAIKYVPEHDVLIIGYASGNIDMMRGNDIVNIAGIVRATLVGSKAINHINYHAGRAYLSCDFGLVVLNVARNEILSSNTTIGTGGRLAAVKATTVLRDSLFLATSEGAKVVSLTRNLMNSQNYRSFGAAEGMPTEELKGMAAWQGRVYAINTQPTGNNGVWQYNQGRWAQVPYGQGRMNNIITYGDSLFVCVNDQVNSIGTGGVLYSKRNTLITEALDVSKTDNASHFWIGDIRSSLLGAPEGILTSFRSNGPYTTSYVRLRTHDNTVMAAGGIINIAGYSATGNRSGYAIFENNTWRNVNAEIGNIGYGSTDVIDIDFNPTDGAYYAATYGKGVIIQRPNGTWRRITDKEPRGSRLVSVIPNDSTYIRTVCVRIDPSGKVWLLNFGSNQGISVIPLHRYDPLRDSVRAYPIPIPGITWENAINMEIANNGDKWLVLADRRDINGTGGFNTVVGMVVVNEAGTRAARITNQTGQGEMPGDVVFDVAKDSQGAMWVAMNKGFGVFYNPGAVLGSGNYRMSLPILNGRPVLENDLVRAIAIDGADRKWVASTTGVYLFDKDITRVVANYTSKNSPLLSDNVNDIAINHVTGEVFFSTDLGICSFRSDATGNPAAQKKECDDVRVFPQPVPPAYSGLITIEGVPANGWVKITDLNGKLVWETRANGSTATWTGKDYNGQQAKSGIYNIFMATEDGSTGCTYKLALVE